jgi:filamentous hemagglutinin family protein
LFHSFGDFNVPPNNIANFLNTPVNGVLPFTSNILARVTGTDGNNPTLSSIYGIIQTTGFGNANLFLMNPAGFLFGPGATVNVGGMVTFTSADYFRLTDGVRFNAVPNAAADALLSTQPVVAFGFLGQNFGAITIETTQLAAKEGQSITLVGGDITIDGGFSSRGILAQNGRIEIACVASTGEVVRTPQGLSVDAFGQLGTVRLTNNAVVDVSDVNGTGAGTIRIRGPLL